MKQKELLCVPVLPSRVFSQKNSLHITILPSDYHLTFTMKGGATILGEIVYTLVIYWHRNIF